MSCPTCSGPPTTPVPQTEPPPACHAGLPPDSPLEPIACFTPAAGLGGADGLDASSKQDFPAGSPHLFVHFSLWTNLFYSHLGALAFPPCCLPSGYCPGRLEGTLSFLGLSLSFVTYEGMAGGTLGSCLALTVGTLPAQSHEPTLPPHIRYLMGAWPSLQPLFPDFCLSALHASPPCSLRLTSPLLPSVQRLWSEEFGQQDQSLIPGPRGRRAAAAAFSRQLAQRHES